MVSQQGPGAATRTTTGKRLGVFTRLLDGASAGASGADGARVYALAREQFLLAERLGYDVGWVAQHHFDPGEGGLPSPLVFLADVAARTTTLRLATGIVALPLEQPLRVAEDAAVVDALSGGRLELGFGSGGSGFAFAAFDRDPALRGRLYDDGVAAVLAALRGEAVEDGGHRLFPDGRRLLADVWQATFSAGGGTRAGAAGSGLLLARTQPRDSSTASATLADLQRPIVDAYLAALPPGLPPRVGASRSVLVGRSAMGVRRQAEAGVARFARELTDRAQPVPDGTVADLIAAFDVIAGTPDDVAAALSVDDVAVAASDVMIQVHPIDPGQQATLASIELFVTEVAPALGWRDAAVPGRRLVAVSS
jgi:putative FMN-dependent luciferase-like monooxygenase